MVAVLGRNGSFFLLEDSQELRKQLDVVWADEQKFYEQANPGPNDWDDTISKAFESWLEKNAKMYLSSDDAGQEYDVTALFTWGIP